MEGSETRSTDQFQVNIGRADKGRTFVRVVHTPSGKQRVLVDIKGSEPQEVASRLIREIQEELSRAM